MTGEGRAPVTVVIADDEPIARQGLRAELRTIEWVQCVGEATSGTSAIDLVDRLKPDVLFLDIEMPGGSGLEVARRITHRPYLVFTTAWSQHAVTAFELGAVDYLLKPFGGERLRVALDRVRAGLGEPRTGGERLLEAMAQGPMTRLFVRSGSAVIPVSIDVVVHLEAWGDYVRVHTTQGRHVVHTTLQQLEERLDPGRFVRVHRGHIVQLTFVESFRAVDGAFVAQLTIGTQVPVSRSHARRVRDLGR